MTTGRTEVVYGSSRHAGGLTYRPESANRPGRRHASVAASGLVMLVAVALWPNPPPVSARPDPVRVLAWANVEGFSHTTARGNDPGRADGRVRIRTIAGVLERQRADLGVLVEFEHPQAAEFRRVAGATFGLVHPAFDTRNTIFYRRTAYQLLGWHTIRVPYFDGYLWRIPIARLRDRVTGRQLTLIAVHNPANTYRFHHQARWRAAAVALEAQAVARLEASGPVLIAGDWNQAPAHRTPLRALTTRTNLHSPILVPIDQAFGSPGVRFTGRWRVTGPAITRATDHRAVYFAGVRA